MRIHDRLIAKSCNSAHYGNRVGVITEIVGAGKPAHEHRSLERGNKRGRKARENLRKKGVEFLRDYTVATSSAATG